VKTFKDFVKPVLIKADPSHGAHATKPIVITALPSHGSHAIKRELKESYERIVSSADKYDSWLDKNDNKHIGKDLDEVSSNLHVHDLPSRRGFKHLKKYTDFSGTLNGHLISKHVGKSHHSDGEKLDHQAKQLDDFIKKHGSSPEKGMKLYHGTQEWNPGEEASKHPKRLIHLPGYTSTSVDKHLANRFAGGLRLNDPSSGSHILEIHTGPEHKGVHLGNHSYFPGERETILPRGLTLKIHPKPRILEHTFHVKNHDTGEVESRARKVHVWKAKIV